MLVINETSGKDTYLISENIKAQITNKTNLVEYKGVDPVKLTNCTHVVFLTNNDNAIKIETDDRWYAAIECCNEVANNKEFFDKIKYEIESKIFNMCFYTGTLASPGKMKTRIF